MRKIAGDLVEGYRRNVIRHTVTASSFPCFGRSNPLVYSNPLTSLRGGRDNLERGGSTYQNGVKCRLNGRGGVEKIRALRVAQQSHQRNFCTVKDKGEGSDLKKPNKDKETTDMHAGDAEEGVKRLEEHGDQQKYLWTTAEAVRYATKHHLDDIGKVYGSIEQTLMSRINESNQRRFRAVLLGGVGAIVWVLFVFGTDIKNWLSGQTAGIAKETLENEQLKIQTQELASAVIQTILNDKDIAAQASRFLQEASGNKETQDALVKLTIQVLRHPDSLRESVELVKKVVHALHDDQETVQKLGILFASSISEPQVRSALVELISELSKDPDVLTAVEELASKVILKPEVYDATTILLGKSTQDILRDDEVIDQSRVFVADVMGDDRLQRKTGTALFNTFSHAISPAVTRCIGAGLMITAVALIQVALSPF